MPSSKSPSKSTIISHYFIPLIISVGVFLFFQWFLILGSACFHCSSALGGIICVSPPLMVGVWDLTRTDDGGESPASSQMMWSDVGSGRGLRMPAAVGVWPGWAWRRSVGVGLVLAFRFGWTVEVWDEAEWVFGLVRDDDQFGELVSGSWSDSQLNELQLFGVGLLQQQQKKQFLKILNGF